MTTAPLTLGDMIPAGRLVIMSCNQCGRRAAKQPADLIAVGIESGTLVSMIGALKRCKCGACGSKDVLAVAQSARGVRQGRAILRDCSCGAKPGEAHIDGCSVARCLWTGGQAIQCEGAFADCVRQLRKDGHDEMAERLAYHLSIDDESHDCGVDVWAGEYPGTAECEEYGFWCVGPPWRAVETKLPDAVHDLNRLVRTCVWNRDKKRWEKPG